MDHPKKIFKELGISPTKRLGQNFLICQSVVERMVKEVNDSFVLEIGPGLGILTRELVRQGIKVRAIEKDRELSKIDIEGANIVRGDVLRTKLPEKSYSVVSNLPFNISKEVVRLLLEAGNQPNRIIVLVQKEVAESMVSLPPKMDFLAVSIRFYADIEKLFDVTRSCFWPQPQTDGAVVKIDNIRKPENGDKFFRIVKRGFQHRRKKLSNNLQDKQKTEQILKKMNLPKNARAETLSIDQWKELVSLL